MTFTMEMNVEKGKWKDGMSWVETLIVHLSSRYILYSDLSTYVLYKKQERTEMPCL